ncbi:hypothetical protein HDU82_008418 [Entophlyctis luteolus]|nr:hypothetical protein HDU82_008418 [Entophlyctis luteolus]
MADNPELPPAYATVDERLPPALYFRRSDWDHLLLLASSVPVGPPVVSVQLSKLSAAYQQFAMSNTYEHYGGTFSGCVVRDLRPQYSRLPDSAATVTVSQKLPKQKIPWPKNLPRPYQNFNNFQFCMHAGYEYHSGEKSFCEFDTHDHRLAPITSASFELPGIQGKFQWMLRQTQNVASTSTTHHLLEFPEGADSILIAVATADRARYFSTSVETYAEAEEKVFGSICFEAAADRFSDDYLRLFVGTLMAVWHGDVLNRDGRLADVLTKRHGNFFTNNISLLAANVRR